MGPIKRDRWQCWQNFWSPSSAKKNCTVVFPRRECEWKGGRLGEATSLWSKDPDDQYSSDDSWQINVKWNGNCWRRMKYEVKYLYLIIVTRLVHQLIITNPWHHKSGKNRRGIQEIGIRMVKQGGSWVFWHKSVCKAAPPMSAANYSWDHMNQL